MACKPSLGRRGFWIVCAALVLSGCQEQEPIRHYLAPKDSALEPAAMRLLAVMTPRGKDVWFFKFLGPQKEVAKHEADFTAFVRSVRFKDQENAPLAWAAPAGWRRQLGPRPRYATLRWGPKGQGLEITITKLGAEAANVRQNVDRWRGQLGLPPLDDDAFHKLLHNTEVDGVPATRVDLIGVLNEDGGAMGNPPRRERPKKEALPFRYTAPDGWDIRPPLDKQGVYIPLVFRIRANGGEAEAMAMPLPGDGGGIAFNVNRWRKQVGLGTLEETRIRQNARSVKVDDKEAVYVDLSGGGAGKRILGIIRPHGGETWFFTLKGPAELVGKEQSHFEAFVTSVRFDGEAGAAHE